MRNKTARFSSLKGEASVVKIIRGMLDDFHLEMMLKPIALDRYVFFSFVM